jgi:cytochrome b subunit of formate dehydrogenase
MSVALAILLLICSGISFLWGGSILASAKSAIHEIEAFLMFLISAVFFSSFVITAAIAEFTRFVKKEANRPPPRP